MVQLNLNAREMTIKIVYYGPALSGKTTNLQQIHDHLDPQLRGRLMSLDTKDDRTLFFDLLPVQFDTKSGLTVKLKLFTVPGQVIHNSTRKLVLHGVDGVAFIADSHVEQWKNNMESFKNLKQNLKANGLNVDNIPLVVQFNKRDLKDVIDLAHIQSAWSTKGVAILPASAINREGVLETLSEILRSTFTSLNEKYRIEDKFGINTEEFIAHILSQLQSK